MQGQARAVGVPGLSLDVRYLSIALYPQPAKQGITGVPGEWPAASPSTPGEWLLPQGTLWGQESGPNIRDTPALRRGRSLPQESCGAAPTGHR